MEHIDRDQGYTFGANLLLSLLKSFGRNTPEASPGTDFALGYHLIWQTESLLALLEIKYFHH